MIGAVNAVVCGRQNSEVALPAAYGVRELPSKVLRALEHFIRAAECHSRERAANREQMPPVLHSFGVLGC